MKRVMTKHLRMSVAAVLLILASAVQADITGVGTTPAVGNLIVGQNNVVNLQWQVATTAGHSSGAQSAQADFIEGGAGIIGTRTVPLSAPLGPGPYSIAEVFVITEAQIQAWVDAGFTQIRYQRQFNDPATGSAATGFITLNISAASLRDIREAGNELDIQRLELRFPNNIAQVQVIERAALVQAELRVNYSGTGLLEGAWQVAEPGSTSGQPVFNTLRVVRDQLSKQQQSILSSPPLPTDKVGKYIPRFCVRGVENADVIDVNCRGIAVETVYQVVESGNQPADLSLQSPQAGSVNISDEFVWNTHPDAVVYQLQIYAVVAGTDGTFITGMLLPETMTSSPLSQLVVSRLQPDKLYEWRVNALDGRGRSVAQSERRRFILVK